MLRKSRYTICTHAQNGEHLLYNTANAAFACCDDASFACLESCSGDEAVLDALEQAGFITHKSAAEELEALHAAFEAQRNDASELMLVLAPTYACNYRCPYCYELGHNSIQGVMDAETMEAVYDFISDRYAEHEFTKLTIEWYGGDPSLALDVVDEMSKAMIAWCEERGIVYDAMMLTNCNLIDEAAVDMLVANHVTSVFITIDGLEATHNVRRVAANGSNSFERNVNAARLFSQRGVKVIANMNADRVNWPEFYELKAYLAEEAGVDLSFGRLCDYGHFFGTRDFKKPTFDLFDHAEFCRHKHEEFQASGFNAYTLRAALAPATRFCNGQRNGYYVIDCRGDVYTCDGWIGEQEHVKFNIFDEPTEEQLQLLSHNPFESDQCKNCKILPLCWGNCDWERRCGNMECHPYLSTLPDYLRDYRSCYGETKAGFTLLAKPMY